MRREERVIALGFFDGVHIGHAALLRRTVEVAGRMGARSAAVTFDVHPEYRILGTAVPLLGTLADRCGLMRRLYGIDEVIALPFDDGMMRMDWRDFVTDCLVREHAAVHLVAGHDFHFGYKGEGNPDRLRALCAELGLGCDILPPVALDGVPVSSSYIRTLIAQGEAERAAEFLGHPHILSGPVRHGKGLGGKLGFPTVNLAIPDGVVIPAHGVYAARAVTEDGINVPAAVNIGLRPTVRDGGGVTAEGFLLGFSGTLYGAAVRLELYKRLRGEHDFGTPAALAAQIARDVEQVRQYFI